MNTLLNQNKAIQYEAFLHLSLFILMPIESTAIRIVLQTNHKNLTEFIKNFQNEKDDENFMALKNRMREILDDLVWLSSV